eukprot:793235-Prorocentrum_minimum.AAC.2
MDVAYNSYRTLWRRADAWRAPRRRETSAHNDMRQCAHSSDIYSISLHLIKKAKGRCSTVRRVFGVP